MSELTDERNMVEHRERSRSRSGVGTLERYASLRSASKYSFAGGNGLGENLLMQHQAQCQQHPNSYSCMTLSKSSGGSGGWRGSGTFSAVGNGYICFQEYFMAACNSNNSRVAMNLSNLKPRLICQAHNKES